MIEFALRRIDTGMLLKRISAFFFDDALNNTSPFTSRRSVIFIHTTTLHFSPSFALAIFGDNGCQHPADGRAAAADDDEKGKCAGGVYGGESVQSH